MKIIKKLYIPLLSLVLVLSCFTVSQMDASAAMSANDHIGPGSNQGGGDHLRSSDIRYPVERENVSCMAYVEVTEDHADFCGCSVYRDITITYSDFGAPYGTSGYCRNCRHRFSYHHTGGGGSSGGGSYVPSHTHNYSTTWGAWRKISSCRLPG